MAFLRHRRYWLLIAAGFAVLVVGTAAVVAQGWSSGQRSGSQTDAAGLPMGPITADFIGSRSDAHVVYPGAAILRTVVHPEGPTTYSLDGASRDVAYLEVFMSTSGSAAAVRDWYRSELAGRHYTCFGAVSATYMYTDDGYIRGNREIVIVGYINPKSIRGIIGQAVPSNRTIFETDYIINPAADAVQHSQLPGDCYLTLPSPTGSPNPNPAESGGRLR